ncbi:conserved protein, unknown function [Hepatocystis sp. ex Piliocolobus tephrosceles]|nr:conserved protein, unknown function [Hepatocystis sp. ex Piliocolobus tephrosceles]
MSLKERLSQRNHANDVVYEAQGQIYHHVEQIDTDPQIFENHASKNLPFFVLKRKIEGANYNFQVNVSNEDSDVIKLSAVIESKFATNESIRCRLALLYLTKQYVLFRSYLTSIVDMYNGMKIIKVTSTGKLRRYLFFCNPYSICIIGKWSRTYLLYEDITQIYIGYKNTPQFALYEERYKDSSERSNYIVLKTTMRDFNFIFLNDVDIIKKLKKYSLLTKIKTFLTKKNPAIEQNITVEITDNSKLNPNTNSTLNSENVSSDNSLLNVLNKKVCTNEVSDASTKNTETKQETTVEITDSALNSEYLNNNDSALKVGKKKVSVMVGSNASTADCNENKEVSTVAQNVSTGMHDNRNYKGILKKYNIVNTFCDYFELTLKQSKTTNINITTKEIKEVIKKNDLIFFRKYNFKNTKINSLFFFLQIQMDICGPELWFTAKFDEYLFTHLN